MKKYIELDLDSCLDCPSKNIVGFPIRDSVQCRRNGDRLVERCEFPFPTWCPLMNREQLEDKWMDEDEARLGITGSCIGDRDSL